MRRLLPDPADPIEPADAYADPARRAAGRPWVMVNMAASVDGATALDGVSGGIGGAGDKAVFRTLRALADVVLVGAGTVRAERYRPRPGVRVAVVSARLALDWSWPLWTDEGTIVVTTTSAGPVPEGVRVVRCGADRVDLAGAIAALGATVVLAEGGPSLNAQLLGAGLVDEVCLTVAPRLLGGPSSRLATGPHASPARWRLAHVLEDDVERLAGRPDRLAAEVERGRGRKELGF